MSRDRRLAADRPVRVVGIPPQTLSAFPPPRLSAYTGALAQSHCGGRVDGVDNNQPHFFISRTKADAAMAITVAKFLEAADYRVLIQDRDMANQNFLDQMVEYWRRRARPPKPWFIIVPT